MHFTQPQAVCVYGRGYKRPSGIPDFRSAKGVLNQPGLSGYRPEQIISHTFLEMKPELFFRVLLLAAGLSRCKTERRAQILCEAGEARAQGGCRHAKHRTDCTARRAVRML